MANRFVLDLQTALRFCQPFNLFYVEDYSYGN